MNNLLENAESSIVKWCVDRAPELIAAGYSSDIQYVELDSRIELKDSELPGTDIIGVTQFSITDQDKFYPIHFIVGVSTLGDENLFRLRKISNELFGRLRTASELTYYDSDASQDAGAPVARSWIKILPGTTLMPTSRVETRPFRFIQVQALLDPLQSASR